MILINWYVTMNNAPKNNQKTSWWDSLKGFPDESVLYDLWASHGKTRLNLLRKWIFDAKNDEGYLVVPRLCEKPIRADELEFFLETRRASLIKRDVEEEVAGFSRCEYCWRFVSVKQATAHRRCVCHICESDLGWVQKRATILGREQNKLVARLRNILRTVWPSSLPPEGWKKNFYTSPEKLEAREPVPPEEHIWFFLPKVHSYILDTGGDPNFPLSTLDTLDPPTPDEPTEVKARRHHIHKLLAGEFSMYRKELVLAEVLLACDEFRPQHGGARVGAGGARAGAGRPRKEKEVKCQGRGRPSTKKIFAV